MARFCCTSHFSVFSVFVSSLDSEFSFHLLLPALQSSPLLCDDGNHQLPYTSCETPSAAIAPELRSFQEASISSRLIYFFGLLAGLTKHFLFILVSLFSLFSLLDES